MNQHKHQNRWHVAGVDRADFLDGFTGVLGVFLACMGVQVSCELESGNAVPTEIRVSAVLNRAPTQKAAQLQTQCAEFENATRSCVRFCGQS
eukprot:6468594-Amphidinium_carterae.1